MRYNVLVYIVLEFVPKGNHVLWVIILAKQMPYWLTIELMESLLSKPASIRRYYSDICIIEQFYHNILEYR